MDVQEILHTIGDRLQSSATVKCVYGDPITAGDRTVIPIARVKFGFGAGGGKFTGSGGGGGVRAEPAGMVEVTPAGSRFIPFRDHKYLVVAFGIGILAGMLLAGRRR